MLICQVPSGTLRFVILVLVFVLVVVLIGVVLRPGHRPRTTWVGRTGLAHIIFTSKGPAASSSYCIAVVGRQGRNRHSGETPESEGIVAECGTRSNWRRRYIILPDEHGLQCVQVIGLDSGLNEVNYEHQMTYSCIITNNERAEYRSFTQSVIVTDLSRLAPSTVSIPITEPISTPLLLSDPFLFALVIRHLRWCSFLYLDEYELEYEHEFSSVCDAHSTSSPFPSPPSTYWMCNCLGILLVRGE